MRSGVSPLECNANERKPPPEHGDQPAQAFNEAETGSYSQKGATNDDYWQ